MRFIPIAYSDQIAHDSAPSVSILKHVVVKKDSFSLWEFLKKFFGRGNRVKIISDTSSEPVTGHEFDENGVCIYCGWSESVLTRRHYTCTKKNPALVWSDLIKIETMLVMVTGKLMKVAQEGKSKKK
jgi:hypothetical protein